ncbi:MAG: hypothetical protein ABI864_03470 [Chloroflexota bacterium]
MIADGHLDEFVDAWRPDDWQALNDAYYADPRRAALDPDPAS